MSTLGGPKLSRVDISTSAAASRSFVVYVLSSFSQTVRRRHPVPAKGAEYCIEHVCLFSVRLSARIFQKLGYMSKLHQRSIIILHNGRGSVLLSRRCVVAMLCASALVDDDTIVHDDQQTMVRKRRMAAQIRHRGVFPISHSILTHQVAAPDWTAECDVQDCVVWWCRSPEARMFSFPFSCCSRRSERPCIDVDVNNKDAYFKYNPNTDVTVYRVGCNRGVTRQLRDVVFAKLRLYGWIAFVLEASNARSVLSLH